MKLRIFSSLLILVLAAVLVIGGMTMAWFTANVSPPSSAAFLIGTVDIDITGEEAEPDEFRWEITEGEDCREFTWTIKNTGSKRAFLRAWLEETLLSSDETAWGEGTPFVVDPGNWAMYFSYTVSEYSEANQKTVRLLAGQHYEAGKVKAWEGDVDGTPTLFVEYTADGWEMAEAQLAVVDDLILIPTTSNDSNEGNPQVGRFPFKAEFEELKDTYLFTIPMQGIYPAGALENRPYDWLNTETLYITVHADLIGIETEEARMNWTQLDCGYEWVEQDGYWYYCLEPVAPGDEVIFCLKGCPEKSGLYTVKLFAEAVQALPEAVEEHWGSDVPCLE